MLKRMKHKRHNRFNGIVIVGLTVFIALAVYFFMARSGEKEDVTTISTLQQENLQTNVAPLPQEKWVKIQKKIKRGDTEGIVNYILMMRKMRVAIFVTDQSGNIKLSFRSKGNISVQGLARDYFGGGGHRNASGGHSKRTLDGTLDYLKKILPAYLETQGIVKETTS